VEEGTNRGEAGETGRRGWQGGSRLRQWQGSEGCGAGLDNGRTKLAVGFTLDQVCLATEAWL
jgi:hypothetical protein